MGDSATKPLEEITKGVGKIGETIVTSLEDVGRGAIKVFTNPSKLFKEAERSLKGRLGLGRDKDVDDAPTADEDTVDAGEDITETLSTFDADAEERSRALARRLREAAGIGPGIEATIATSKLGVTKAAKRLRKTLG